MKTKAVPKVGDPVRWKWRVVPQDDGTFRTDYLHGTVVALYGPSEDPVTVDVVGETGRSAHRWWNLEILQPEVEP